MRISSFLVFSSLVLVACGPTVSEVHMIAAPPKEANCELDFLQLKMEDVSPAAPGAKYEILGHVVLQEEGVRDPLEPKYREKVRPRACRMGGEGVAIMLSAVGEGAFGSHGTSIDYAVVRKRQSPAASAAPAKF
ncbi:hypothetical protein LZC95_45000 [Pendulispora brunnea]|uniref:Lipoprotein n=1 Tax=Pendulispora brunnea TaxID=2905690 RepID=A0ABZ2K4H3_9BACT